MVIGFEQEKESRQGYGICAFGQWDLVKILARKWGNRPPSPSHSQNVSTSYWKEYSHLVTVTAIETF